MEPNMMRMILVFALSALPSVVSAQERVLDAGILRFYQGNREVGRERFKRALTTFETSTAVPVLNLRLDYSSKYDDRGKLARVEATAYDLSADTVIRAYTAIADGDSLRCTQTEASGAERNWSVAATADLSIGAQTVAAFLEAVERAAGQDTVYTAWSPELNRTTTVTVTFRGDTVDLESESLPLTAILGPDGRVRVIEVAVQRLRVERAGTETLPPLEGLERPEPNYDAPPDASYTAEDVRITITPDSGDAFELAGTLTLPKEGSPPYPAVITISGSGGQNRDEELWPLVAGYRIFGEIAEHLADHGIAVLRVDDRGVGESGGSTEGITTQDLANDVRAELAWLRGRPEIDPDRIALVGHSEGGVIAPIVAASDPRVAAIVLMAGTAKNGVEVLKDQARWPIETAPGLSEQRKQELVAEALAGLEADTANPNAWLRWFRQYDPLPTARRVTQPVLILQGALDRQVTAGQADTLAAAIRESGNPDVTERVFPRLNHLFLESPTDGSPAEYSSLEDVHVPGEVLDTLAQWLVERLAPR
jgi:dienelactone hydrolase